MATKAFVIPTVPNRIQGLKRLLESIKAEVDDTWDILIAAQCYSEAERDDMTRFIDELGLTDRTVFKTSEKPLGCFGGRKLCYQSDYDVYCNLDDDMIILPTQNYNTMAKMVLKYDFVGCVSGNWGRTFELAQKKIPKMKSEFIKQSIVHTAGGMVFGRRVRDLIISMPDNIGYEDSEISAKAYVNGYENYRYLGSLIVHAVVTKGGLKDWRHKHDAVVPHPEIFDYKRAKKDKYATKGNNHHEPISSDLTPFARAMHLKNRKR